MARTNPALVSCFGLLLGALCCFCYDCNILKYNFHDCGFNEVFVDDESAESFCGVTVAVDYYDGDTTQKWEFESSSQPWTVSIDKNGGIAYWTSNSAGIFSGYYDYCMCGSRDVRLRGRWTFAVRDEPTAGSVSTPLAYSANLGAMPVAWSGFGGRYGCGTIDNFFVEILDPGSAVVGSVVVGGGVTSVSVGAALVHGVCYRGRVRSSMTSATLAGNIVQTAAAVSGSCTQMDTAPPALNTNLFVIDGESLTPAIHETKSQSSWDRIVIKFAAAVGVYAPVASYDIAIGSGTSTCNTAVGTVSNVGYASPFTVSWAGLNLAEGYYHVSIRATSVTGVQSNFLCDKVHGAVFVDRTAPVAVPILMGDLLGTHLRVLATRTDLRANWRDFEESEETLPITYQCAFYWAYMKTPLTKYFLANGVVATINQAPSPTQHLCIYNSPVELPTGDRVYMARIQATNDVSLMSAAFSRGSVIDDKPTMPGWAGFVRLNSAA
eukprot:TRINITY_DN1293_c0_g1_i1.p1 TRINITY_DN1293_c0_g1~~TRINITY_DN1293_c0_g1_i1.p1  ORF type:complete len:493 (-),score=53.85 TRINITY_DN1293_c0_g1_i1:142-1620(-)